MCIARNVLPALALLLLSCVAHQTDAAGILIDSVFGERSIYVPGIEIMSQSEVTRHAALWSLSPEGWDPLSVGGFLHRRGTPQWSGGVEWTVAGVPAEVSDGWGYELNGEAVTYGNGRELQFHTDDSVS